MWGNHIVTYQYCVGVGPSTIMIPGVALMERNVETSIASPYTLHTQIHVLDSSKATKLALSPILWLQRCLMSLSGSVILTFVTVW